ncbi:unnamed protein product [Caenorhabditis bovis]|uniref:UDP-glucuronosyltransferase n=1 Tax=Caenorhabditis bovis TaxID=2654633 RepID=A0A8S1EYD9_9PELO|nr:unnamed protein product [Caenorhabditis bovis]
MRILLLLLLLVVGSCSAYKMLVFVPNMANSQVQFCTRVAAALADAGHDVTMAMITHLSDFKHDVKIPKNIKVYEVDAFVEGLTQEYMHGEQAKFMFRDVSPLEPEMFRLMNLFTTLQKDGCRMLLRNKEFLKWLESEKFDIAFAYIYSTCPVGIIHHAKIPTWIWLNSGGLMDYVANTIGVPIIPSYVPPMMMEAHDTLTFYERIKSFIGHTLLGLLSRSMMATKYTEVFREEIDPNFPHTMDLAEKCPLVMVNSNELYDLPRPTLAKVVNIGGLGVGFDAAKPLTGEFEKIINSGKGTIVFSFGSVAAAHKMPEFWKSALLEAFAEFADYQFVMRYVENDLNDRLPKNVHLFKWLPQKDLLLHNNTKAFISHGGYNSLQESISSGTPLVTIALFGDQPKNSKIALKHGIAVNIAKSEISKETIVSKLKEILENPMYSNNVKRISQMVRKQPTKPAELLVKWSEFVAEFKNSGSGGLWNTNYTNEWNLGRDFAWLNNSEYPNLLMILRSVLSFC